MTTVVWTSEIRDIIVSSPENLTGSCNSSTSGWGLNSTEQATSVAPSDDDYGSIPVIGYPGPLFTAIHVAALVSLTISSSSAAILLIYLCGFKGSVKDQARGTAAINCKVASSKPGQSSTTNEAVQQQKKKKKKKRLSFWKWSVGERFVVYLGFSDLFHSVSHFLDHAYIFYAKQNPPDLICTMFAFFLHSFVFVQWSVVATTAASACSLIVFGRRMSLGRFDWRLMAFAVGIPTSISLVALSQGLLGASGAWCYIKYGAPSWRLYTQITNTIQISSFGLVGVAYGAIWIKIQRTTKLMKGSTTERYQSSAKVMMIFVAAFILQWWPYTLFNIWSIFSDPPPPVIVIAVIFCNLGGLYNSIAYTVIRRRLQRQGRKNSVVNNIDSNITHSTAADSQRVASRTASCSRAVVHDPDGILIPECHDVLDDPSVPSEGWDVDAVAPGVSQVDKMTGEGQGPDSEDGLTQDVDPTQILVHI